LLLYNLLDKMHLVLFPVFIASFALAIPQQIHVDTLPAVQRRPPGHLEGRAAIAKKTVTRTSTLLKTKFYTAKPVTQLTSVYVTSPSVLTVQTTTTVVR
jgi:hypothetical protein